MDTKKLLETRARQKKRKPYFLKQDVYRKKRLKMKWKKPRGLHSKLRHNFKGAGANVMAGYGSPAAVRGYHHKGVKPVVVNSVAELAGINPKNEGVIIGKMVGLKNRLIIVKKALEMKLIILNLKEPEKFLKETEESIKKKKEEKQKKEADKEKKHKEKEKAAAEKEKKEEKQEKPVEAAEEKKKEEEKKEFDKLLTQKE